MPELPEVEMVRSVIGPAIIGRKIARAKVYHAQVIARPDAGEFVSALAGQVVSGMARRGKFMRIELESGDHLVLHLRMTGGLLLLPPDAPLEKHTHLALCFADEGDELRFDDLRRFGRFWLIRRDEEDVYSGMERLGPEPGDARVTADYLRERLGRSRRAIKECLMDQTVIAGIGNIYSDEILFSTRIRPERPACGLTEEEWAELAECIPARMAFFVARNAISREEYERTRGREYRNTPYLQVYGHGGEPCPVCGTTLMRQVIGGRGSVYCPQCQKET